jgi:clan AA aspartic protease (TIGR02281 family)
MRWFLISLLLAANLWVRNDEAGWTAPDQSVVPLHENSQALMVDAVLNKHVSGVFIVDTGATYTSISHQMADDLGLDLEHCEKIAITTANGRIMVPKVHIKHLALKGVVGHDIEATVMDIKPGASFSGLLGLSFMKQYRVTIDAESRQLIFQQGGHRQIALNDKDDDKSLVD